MPPYVKLIFKSHIRMIGTLIWINKLGLQGPSFFPKALTQIRAHSIFNGTIYQHSHCSQSFPKVDLSVISSNIISHILSKCFIEKLGFVHMLQNLVCHFFYKTIGPKMAHNITYLMTSLRKVFFIVTFRFLYRSYFSNFIFDGVKATENNI